MNELAIFPHAFQKNAVAIHSNAPRLLPNPSLVTIRELHVTSVIVPLNIARLHPCGEKISNQT
jgi:hypothetical protein